MVVNRQQTKADFTIMDTRGNTKRARERYTKIDPGSTGFLGEGTYGQVYKAYDKDSDKIVAIKTVKLTDPEVGIPATTVREVAILKELQHVNLVQLMDVILGDVEISLVMELADCDLRSFMKKKGRLNPHRTPYLPKDLVQTFTHQILLGIDHCHKRRIIHRDLKPQNLLIVEKPNEKPILKIADFGLARTVAICISRLTQEVVTIWYRAPEILLGMDEYSHRVDMWSVGCILGEMASGMVLFMGNCEIDTLYKIFQKLGTPNVTNSEEWPAVAKLPNWNLAFPKWQKFPWQDIKGLGKLLGNYGCELLTSLTLYDPSSRITAKIALKYPYIEKTIAEIQELESARNAPGHAQRSSRSRTPPGRIAAHVLRK